MPKVSSDVSRKRSKSGSAATRQPYSACFGGASATKPRNTASGEVFNEVHASKRSRLRTHSEAGAACSGGPRRKHARGGPRRCQRRRRAEGDRARGGGARDALVPDQLPG